MKYSFWLANQYHMQQGGHVVLKHFNTYKEMQDGINEVLIQPPIPETFVRYVEVNPIYKVQSSNKEVLLGLILSQNSKYYNIYNTYYLVGVKND